MKFTKQVSLCSCSGTLRKEIPFSLGFQDTMFLCSSSFYCSYSSSSVASSLAPPVVSTDRTLLFSFYLSLTWSHLISWFWGLCATVNFLSPVWTASLNVDFTILPPTCHIHLDVYYTLETWYTPSQIFLFPTIPAPPVDLPISDQSCHCSLSHLPHSPSNPVSKSSQLSFKL